MSKKKQLAEQQRQQRLQAEAARIAKAIEFKQNLEQMQQSGDLDRTAKLLAMAYQVFTQANSYAEEAVYLMEQYKIVHSKAKTAANNLMQSFNAYDKVMQGMLGMGEDKEGANRQFCFDTEMLSVILDGFMENNIEVERGPYYAPKLFLPQKQQ